MEVDIMMTKYEKVFCSWEDVFMSFTDKEKAEIKANAADFCGVESVTDDKVVSDVAIYFDEYVDGSENVYQNEVPDVVNGVPAFTKANFLWALS